MTKWLVITLLMLVGPIVCGQDLPLMHGNWRVAGNIESASGIDSVTLAVAEQVAIGTVASATDYVVDVTGIARFFDESGNKNVEINTGYPFASVEAVHVYIPLTVYETGYFDGTVTSGGANIASILIDGETPPVNSNDTGIAGTIRWDSNYIYVCVGTDTWKRAALSSW